MNNKKNLLIKENIQILRGISVLLVLLYHLKIPFFQNGFLGVDIFFVISGYLMVKIYEGGNYKNFYLNRIKRILPAYLITILITLIVAKFITVPSDFAQLINQLTSSFLFYQNFYFWSQNSYFSNDAFNPLLHLWSLGIEIQFYLIVPLLIPLFKKIKILIFFFFISFLACLIVVLISPKTSFFLLPFRLWEFIFGILVASRPYLVFKKKSTRNILTLISFIIALITLTKINIDQKDIFLGHPSILTFLITFCSSILIANKWPKSITGSNLGKIFIQVGNISYSLYLIHFPIIVLFNYEVFSGTILGYKSNFELVKLLILIIILTMFSYKLFERNPIFIKNIKISSFSFYSVILILVIIFNNINYFNYTDNQKKIFFAWKDRDTYRCGKIFRILNPLSQLCEITKIKGSKNALLLGDSHADSIKYSYSNEAEQFSFNVYFFVDNDPLIGRIGVEKIVDYVEKLDIKLVTIHYSNIYYNKLFKEKFIDLINILNKKSIKVNVIAPIPSYKEKIPKILYEKSIQKKNNYEWEVSRDLYDKKNSEFNSFIKKNKSLNINVYDTKDIFCKEFKCSIINKNGEVYYFDSSHLTKTGADQLIPIFRDIFKKKN